MVVTEITSPLPTHTEHKGIFFLLQELRLYFNDTDIALLSSDISAELNRSGAIHGIPYCRLILEDVTCHYAIHNLYISRRTLTNQDITILLPLVVQHGKTICSLYRLCTFVDQRPLALWSSHQGSLFQLLTKKLGEEDRLELVTVLRRYRSTTDTSIRGSIIYHAQGVKLRYTSEEQEHYAREFTYPT